DAVDLLAGGKLQRMTAGRGRRVGERRGDVTSRTARRGRRSGEHAMTLIEAVVALALVAVAIVALVVDLAAAQRTVTVAQDQASADAQLRYVGDYLRDHDRAAYQLCAAPSAYSVPNPPTGPALNPQHPVVAVTLGRSASRNGVPISPLRDCSTGATDPATCAAASTPPGCDYGVQELTITQTVGGTTLTRTVWKSVP
ncbi:MAG TPA: hypothetical protein VFO60_02880, partial [Candidatus Dormibacteraeota bacterium]|nr:hypothetical protein [Candidatus Dormibacteraeota bacterium]